MAPGRNDPCPCGSGEKYKRCCGKPRVAGGVAEATKESTWKQLLSFARRDEFERDRATAQTAYWGSWAHELSPDELAALAAHPLVAMNFESLFALDVPIEGDKGLADLFLERRAHTLTNAERAYLENLARSYVGLYEVVAASDEALTLRDLLEPRELVAGSASSTPDVDRGEIVAMRIVGDDFEADLYVFPPEAKETVLERIRAELGDTDSLAAAMKRVASRFHSLWVELVGTAEDADDDVL